MILKSTAQVVDQVGLIFIVYFSHFSNGREWLQAKTGRGASDSAADQIANRWGRNGGDPNVYRPKGLPKRY